MKPRDSLSRRLVDMLQGALARARSCGTGHAEVAERLSRSGRPVSVHTVRSWVQESRPNMIGGRELLALIVGDALPEEANLDLWRAMAMARGGVAVVELPEPVEGDPQEIATLIVELTGELGRVAQQFTRAADGGAALDRDEAAKVRRRVRGLNSRLRSGASAVVAWVYVAAHSLFRRVRQ